MEQQVLVEKTTCRKVSVHL